MTKTRSALLLILLMFGLVFLPQSFRVQAQNQTGALVVRIDPAETESLDVNDNFTMYVRVDNAVGIEGAQVQLTYDRMVLNASQVVEGPFLPSAGQTIVAQQLTKNISDTLAEVDYSSAIITGTTASGNGILLNITFTVLSEGSAHLQLIPYSASGTYPGTYFLDLQYTVIVPSLVDGFYGTPVSLTANPTLIYVGETTTLSGKVSGSSVASVTSVDFLYAVQGGNWIELGTAPTNSSGYFQLLWTASEEGIFSFQVTFTFAGKTSNSTFVEVRVQPRLAGYSIYVLYASVGVLAFIVALAIIMHVKRMRKQSSELPPIA